MREEGRGREVRGGKGEIKRAREGKKDEGGREGLPTCLV